MGRGLKVWIAFGHENPARDSAVALLRLAYIYPTIEVCRVLETVTTECWMRKRVLLRRRVTNNYIYGNFIRFHLPFFYYDRLYSFIKGNKDLARSISRFVRWVKEPDDLIELLDVFLVQTMAKRVVRYQYYGDGGQPWRIAEVVGCLGTNEVTRPSMEWLWRRAFFYPRPLAGLPDYVITGTDRDGRSPIGSYSYMIGELSADVAGLEMEKYILLGGDPKYDTRNPKLCPKTESAIEFYFRSRTAGLALPRMGDVAGPDKRSWQYFGPAFWRGAVFWRWTGDPRWAWVVKNFSGKGG